MFFRRAQRMRCVEHIVVALRSFQKGEHDEAWHIFEMRLAREPDLLEVALASPSPPESLHRMNMRELRRKAMARLAFSRGPPLFLVRLPQFQLSGVKKP